MNAVALLLAPAELAEPTDEDLAAIDAEGPVLAAELAVVDAECRWLICPDALTRRHLRRAQAALARVLAVRANHPRIGDQP